MDEPRTPASNPIDVAIVDDDDSIREGCRQVLEEGGYSVATASDGTQGLSLVTHGAPRLVLIDLKMAGIGGMEVLGNLPHIDPRIVPIVITGYGTVDAAVASMKLGAFDFLCKPFDAEHLLETVAQAMRQWEAFSRVPACPMANVYAGWAWRLGGRGAPPLRGWGSTSAPAQSYGSAARLPRGLPAPACTTSCDWRRPAR